MNNKIIVTNINKIGDPVILLEDNVYYMYTTCCGGKPFHVYTSLDCKTFTDMGECLHIEDTFADRDIWAPEVIKYQGKFYMFYSGRSDSDGLMHVQIAVSNSPLGPFKDIAAEPIIKIEGKSTIDAHCYIEDDEKYLFFSMDCSTNIINGIHTSQIYAVKLSSDFKSTVGDYVFISTPDAKYEELSGPHWRWNEGPFILKNNGKYFMTYSSNCYNSLYYCVGCSVSDNILGPYKKQEEKPILEYIENEISGPGHNAFFIDKDSKLKCVFHIHDDYNAPSGNRTACICDAYFDSDNKLVIDYK